ncbi:hypothetical protein RFI_30267 [Reticulomyxa filosa]|uniref:Uncharacterized protein n=1 Tax=Reticulomyxa filosa TaxID=46433 RepID=X6LYW3_RETFI|nr:hypothetical protein RFI_30267 [Reticulomyxa filosa]|eukprot:ETO07123.1 hypothetical protein RFI_30267 [Reticulomyxa filosa]
MHKKQLLNKAIENFNLEIFNIMAEINNEFMSKATVKKNEKNHDATGKRLHNNKLLQHIFTDKLFDNKSGLSKFTKKK